MFVSFGLDPLNAGSWDSLAEAEFFAGRFDEAAAHARKALELSADVWPGHILLSKIYLMEGRPEDALPEIERVRYDSQRAFLYALAYQAMGRKKEAESALSEVLAGHSAYLIATVYAHRNQSDQAFEWLDRAYVQRDGDVIGTRVDPLLKNLHNDPRYAAFLKRIRLPN